MERTHENDAEQATTTEAGAPENAATEAPGAQPLTNSDLVKTFWAWNCMSQAVYSYERMQGPAFALAMSLPIAKLYGNDKKATAAALKRHMEFYNTEPWFVGPMVVGLATSMEEQKAAGVPISGEDISGVKVGLMGPLAGVGDTLRQGTLIPIIGSIAISLGVTGNFLGPIFYMAATLGINHGVAYMLYKSAYKRGKEEVNNLFASGMLERYMTMATTVGAVTIGGLAASTVKLTTPMTFALSENSLALQDLVDKIIPGLLPLAVVFCTLLMLNKKISATKVLLILIAATIVGVLVGLF